MSGMVTNLLAGQLWNHVSIQDQECVDLYCYGLHLPFVTSPKATEFILL